MIKNDPFLQQRMVQSRAGSQLYLDGYVSPVRQRKSSGKVTVIENTTFQCAREVIEAYGKVAVLNFANPQEPGCGAFRNDPALMAKAFADVLIREQYAVYFKHVIFAIKKTGIFCPNLSAFEEAFRG